MPAPRRGWQGCKSHCFIWFGSNGVVQRGCAHCNTVSGKHAEEDEALLLRQVAASREAHARSCNRPIR